jgi:hypothetical protein
MRVFPRRCALDGEPKQRDTFDRTMSVSGAWTGKLAQFSGQ